MKTSAKTRRDLKNKNHRTELVTKVTHGCKKVTLLIGVLVDGMNQSDQALLSKGLDVHFPTTNSMHG